MRRFFDYIGINLRCIRLLELLIAMYPILMGYQYGGVPCALLFIVVMDILAYVRKTSMVLPSKYMTLLSIFVVAHEVVLCSTMQSIPSFHVNNIISLIIIFSSIFIIVPAIEFERLKGCVNIVAIICMIGMLYHFVVLQTGHYISPIKVPFMPDLQTSARLYSEVYRPCSFFWEPQSYCTFMSIPLFYSLIYKKYLWTVMIVLSMFLSTSTTGIAISFLSILTYVLTQKASNINKIMIIITGVTLLYFLMTSDMFSASVDKMESTSYEHSSRLYNGPTFVANMNKEDLLLGINFASTYDYYVAGNVKAYLFEKHDTIFIPSFWNVLVKFGIVGAFLFLAIYVESFYRCRKLCVYVIPLIVALFTNPDYLGGLFAFEFIIIYSFINHENKSI